MPSTPLPRRVLAWFRASWRSPWRGARRVCTATFAVAAIVGALGVWVMRSIGWLGDVIAIGMPVLVLGAWAIAVIVVVRRGNWPVVAALLGVSAAMAAVIVAPRLPDETGPPTRALVIVAANLLYDNPRPATGVASVMAQHPDVLVVSELTAVVDELLAPQFPYRALSAGEFGYGDYAEGVYSTVPLEVLTPPTGLDNQLLRVRVQGPEAFILYGIHLPRPSTRNDFHMVTYARQRADVDHLDAVADAETEPVVIAGDLNLSDRAAGYSVLGEGRHDATRTRWAGTTYVGGWLFELFALRIDHLFIPGDWCASGGGNFALAGSDHRGIRSTVGPCA